MELYTVPWCTWWQCYQTGETALVSWMHWHMHPVVFGHLGAVLLLGLQCSSGACWPAVACKQVLYPEHLPPWQQTMPLATTIFLYFHDCAGLQTSRESIPVPLRWLDADLGSAVKLVSRNQSTSCRESSNTAAAVLLTNIDKTPSAKHQWLSLPAQPVTSPGLPSANLYISTYQSGPEQEHDRPFLLS